MRKIFLKKKLAYLVATSLTVSSCASFNVKSVAPASDAPMSYFETPYYGTKKGSPSPLPQRVINTALISPKTPLNAAKASYQNLPTESNELEPITGLATELKIPPKTKSTEIPSPLIGLNEIDGKTKLEVTYQQKTAQVGARVKGFFEVDDEVPSPSIEQPMAAVSIVNDGKSDEIAALKLQVSNLTHELTSIKKELTVIQNQQQFASVNKARVPKVIDISAEDTVASSSFVRSDSETCVEGSSKNPQKCLSWSGQIRLSAL